MANDLPSLIPGDIVARAEECLAAVVFLQSTGKGARLSVAIARGCNTFREFEADAKSKGYFVGFDANPADLGRLRALMPLITLWRGTLLFLKGRPTRWDHNIERTLDCYLKAQTHPTPLEYCVVERQIGHQPLSMSVTIRLPGELPPLPPPALPKVRLPCRLLGATRWNLGSDGPSLASQAFSEAIERECAWCPNFDHTRAEAVLP